MFISKPGDVYFAVWSEEDVAKCIGNLSEEIKKFGDMTL